MSSIELGSGYLSDSLLYSSKLTSIQFNKIIDIAFNTLLSTLANESNSNVLQVSQFKELDTICMKSLYSSLITIVVESYKLEYDNKKFSDILNDYNINNIYLVEMYSLHYSTIRSKLNSINTSFPKISGIDWRLDYLIKSNSVEHINQPVYFINLKLDNNKLPIKFTASLQQLQDLHAKILDATKAVERISNQKDVAE